MKTAHLLSYLFPANKEIKPHGVLKAFILGIALITSSVIAKAQYCDPENVYGCSFGDQYVSFITTGGASNIDHVPASNCVGDEGGYAQFSGAGLSLSEMHGTTISLSILNNASRAEGYAVWIDWNQDNIFQPSEEVFATDSAIAPDSIANGSFAVPEGTVLGSTTLRIRCVYDSAGTSIDPCAVYSYGSTFDFPDTVLNTPPAFVLGSAIPLSDCGDDSINISATLAIGDIDSGQTETWSLVTPPVNGTASVAYFTTSTGSAITPTGLSYVPDSGYIGTDSFTVQVNDGAGGAANTTVYVTVNPIPAIASDSVAAVCAGATSAILSYAGLTNAGAQSATFSYSGAIQSWTVPVGVTNITLSASGAQGGSSSTDTGGTGANMSGSFVVTPGDVLNILTGQQGQNGSNTGGGGGGSYVWDVTAGNVLLIAAGGGGGAGLGGTGHNNAVTTNDGTDDGYGSGGGGVGGNGATDALLSPTGNYAAGGAGWYSNGANGYINIECSISQGGMDPSNGGAGGSYGGTSGLNGSGGFGGGGGSQGYCSWVGGGGGGGYSGGAGGGFTGAETANPGGGGGSFNGGTAQSNTISNMGNGQIVINYTVPSSSYSIVWDSAALAAGFTDTTGGALPDSLITVAVPDTGAAGTYNGTLTISNATCTSVGYPVSVTINPTPGVNPIANPSALCNTVTATAIYFTGSAVAGTVYTWTNSDSTIGVPSSGIDSVGSFAATDTTDSIVSGIIMVTPVANGCVGAVQSFTITVAPTPNVTASSNQTVCNGTMTAGITFTGSVAGSSFSWTNTNTGIGLAGSGLDSIPAFTAINDSTYDTTASITVTAAANGCVGTSNSFAIQVDPTPQLSSLLVLPAICDSTLLTYTPESATAGTTYSWSRDTVSGISNGATVGTGGVSETLVNTTASPVGVTYVYTLFADICTNTQNVTVTVNPLPMLSTSITPPAICDSSSFIYGPGSATAGAVFSWSRAVVPGVSNGPGSGADTINEILVNTSNIPVTVVYVDTLTANGCSNTQNITVTVNPMPVLTTATAAPSVCDSTLFTYIPNSTIGSTVFTWSRAAITGISNPAASGGDTISEVLINTTANPINVVYIDSMTAYGCVYTQDVNVTVNPTPMLSSSTTPPGLCDSAFFNYTPTSATTGATFAWDRPIVSGIALDSAGGTGNPDEQLINTTNLTILAVTYIYTVTANGCSNIQDVVVNVYPTPTLSSDSDMTICSGTPLVYVPENYVFGATYTWTRPGVAGILPTTSSGDSIISETLTDTTLVPIVTSYVFTLMANGCTHVQDVKVTVNPAPPSLGITTHPPSALCSNTQYQNFGTNIAPPAGQQYTWSATNATVWAVGNTGQYCLVNFPESGTAVITLNSNVTGISCITNNTYTVNVSGSTSGMPEVIYFNGQFLCLQNDEDSYQWGYDDKITLDSTAAPGEMNQNYFITSPDVIDRYYWVITTQGDCMQKSYYNAPTGITNVNTGGLTEIKVFPNPANNLINLTVNTTVVGNIEVEVLDMLGQKLATTEAIDHRAQINVAALPAGCYLIDCYREGVKIGAARFVKD